MHKKRLFIAIPLPAYLRDSLASVSREFLHPALRWTPPQNLHVTLCFLGSVDNMEMEHLTQCIAQASATTPSFSLMFAQLKVIAKRRKPEMLWAVFEHSVPFTQLALQLQLMLRGKDTKIPLPHITLARFKENRVQLSVLPFVRKFTLPVQRIELWESVLGNATPVYKSLQQFPLGK